MFNSKKQYQDWHALQDAIDESPVAPPCTNFPEAWFPIRDELQAEGNMAKNLCKTSCPVVKQCAVYGLRWEQDGIWGGITAGERNRIRSAALKQELYRSKSNAI
jgi:hypothetical protein